MALESLIEAMKKTAAAAGERNQSTLLLRLKASLESLKRDGLVDVPFEEMPEEVLMSLLPARRKNGIGHHPDQELNYLGPIMILPDVFFDFQRQRIFHSHQGLIIHFTLQEAQLFQLFLSNREQIVSKELISQHVGHHGEMSYGSIAVLVSNVRIKIIESSLGDRIEIFTHRRKGFELLINES